MGGRAYVYHAYSSSSGVPAWVAGCLYFAVLLRYVALADLSPLVLLRAIST